MLNIACMEVTTPQKGETHSGRLQPVDSPRRQLRSDGRAYGQREQSETNTFHPWFAREPCGPLKPLLLGSFLCLSRCHRPGFFASPIGIRQLFFCLPLVSGSSFYASSIGIRQLSVPLPLALARLSVCLQPPKQHLWCHYFC